MYRGSETQLQVIDHLNSSHSVLLFLCFCLIIDYPEDSHIYVENRNEIPTHVVQWRTKIHHTLNNKALIEYMANHLPRY